MVVLKRLAEALADGDMIHAIIKGSAMNNDGSLKVGYTAPSVEGQAEVIAEALSVAGVLGVDATAVPATMPYLRADDELQRTVASEITRIAGGARKVGLSWAGALHSTSDRRRSCPLAFLAPLFDVNGVAWFSLQKGDAEKEIGAVPNGARLVHLDARNEFDGTAALTAAMDLIISVDTSIAHLAGALARPTWILLPFAADWRWGDIVTRSPWYPNVRLFRQPRRGDWTSVVAEVRAALAEWAGRR